MRRSWLRPAALRDILILYFFFPVSRRCRNVPRQRRPGHAGLERNGTPGHYATLERGPSSGWFPAIPGYRRFYAYRSLPSQTHRCSICTLGFNI
ncbi:hypothetical protein GGR52DRAFT_528586 [Hypoxylon sp. FL1284]|nr:hypothetical protein GGR52DRAFT_528586 [Hypoxylon sp. FL1284]